MHEKETRTVYRIFLMMLNLKRSLSVHCGGNEERIWDRVFIWYNLKYSCDWFYENDHINKSCIIFFINLFIYMNITAHINID